MGGEDTHSIPSFGLTSSEDDASDDDDDQSCTGCHIKSKVPGTKERVKWARYRKKKRRSRGGMIKFRKVPTGTWCVTCFNYYRTHVKDEVATLDQAKDKLVGRSKEDP